MKDYFECWGDIVNAAVKLFPSRFPLNVRTDAESNVETSRTVLEILHEYAYLKASERLQTNHRAIDRELLASRRGDKLLARIDAQDGSGFVCEQCADGNWFGVRHLEVGQTITILSPQFQCRGIARIVALSELSHWIRVEPALHAEPGDFIAPVGASEESATAGEQSRSGFYCLKCALYMPHECS